MSRNARIATLAALVVAAAVTFVVLRPSDDDSTTSTATPTTTTSAQATSTPATTTTTTTTAAPTPAPVPTITVKAGKPIDGVKSITVKKGDQIRFKVVVDEPQNVHLHGYDIEKRATPDAPAGYSVPATIDGVFEIELEDTGVQIGKLTVEP